MKPSFFSDCLAFRKWLMENHKEKTELWVGYYKVACGKPSMTWSQSVDEALCFGWIDGIRKSIDDESYCIRFTPRRPTGNWSAINIAKVKDFLKKGLMQPAGIAAFNQRNEKNSEVYSFEKNAEKLSHSFVKRFMANASAWDFFSQQAPSYKRTICHWIMSAKKEATQLKRLEKTIAESERQKRIM